jgi:hypothetical protein
VIKGFMAATAPPVEAVEAVGVIFTGEVEAVALALKA